jgi:hypothetical protein
MLDRDTRATKLAIGCISSGARATTIKCALDAVRHVLDVEVESGISTPTRRETGVWD